MEMWRIEIVVQIMLNNIGNSQKNLSKLAQNVYKYIFIYTLHIYRTNKDTI